MSDDEQQGFKVRDRRRFDAEGKLRPEDQQEPDASDQPHDLPPQQPDESASAQAGGAADGLPAIDFSTFVLSLSTSAMVHLGEAPTPEGQTENNLQMARQVIDIIAMLQQKTRGNLAEDEDKLVEQLLYDLRMRYVHAAG